MHVNVSVSTAILDTPRVAQVRGMFDMPEAPEHRQEWSAELPIEARPWNIGLIVGPSGAGKTTIARQLWPEALSQSEPRPSPRACVDAFPAVLPIKQVVEILSSVGFSSPPAWLRPYHVLSTGQKFRVQLALAIARALDPSADRSQAGAGKNSAANPIVFDEYTSVVDRTVAQVASAALARTIRKHALQFVAVTCHEDVEEWLQPDWVLRPETMDFRWRELCRRPAIDLTLVRTSAKAWPLFAPHHYLSHQINRCAVCFLAIWRDKPVAFSAWLPFVARGPKTRREHRTVTLPDYQGVGIGNALANTIAAMWRAFGYRATSTTTHPGMIAYRNRHPDWRIRRPPGFTNKETHRVMKCANHASTRLTAGFEYVGPPLPLIFARSLHADK